MGHGASVLHVVVFNAEAPTDKPTQSVNTVKLGHAAHWSLFYVVPCSSSFSLYLL